MKKFSFFLLTLFFTVFFCFFPSFLDTKKETSLEEEKEISYTLLFAGDIMLDRGVEQMVKKHGEESYSFPFLEILEDLKEADILFGNLESMISNKGRNVGSIYSFRAEESALDGLVFAGFDVLNLANNHTFDYTREAFEDTMKKLKERGVEYTGSGFNIEEARSPAVITIVKEEEVVSFGFLGYTDLLFPSATATSKRSGVVPFSLENIEEDIKSAKEKVDFLVVTFHYGDEYAKERNEKQVLFSRKAIDYGADIVIGHHPHVTQTIEKYNGSYIAYSLGNFVFDQYFSEETMKGFLLKVEISEGIVKKATKVHYKLNNFYQPKVVIEEDI